MYSWLVKKELSTKALNLCLHCNPHLWAWAGGGGVSLNIWHCESFQRGAGLRFRDWVMSSAIWELLPGDLLFLPIKRSHLRRFGDLTTIRSECLLVRCEVPRGWPRTHSRACVSQMAWEWLPQKSCRRQLGRGRCGHLWLDSWNEKGGARHSVSIQTNAW